MTTTSTIKRFLYGWKFFVNYGAGEEYECFETERKAMQEQVKRYRQNCRYPLTVRRGRTYNPAWMNQQIDLAAVTLATEGREYLPDAIVARFFPSVKGEDRDSMSNAVVVKVRQLLRRREVEAQDGESQG